MHDKNTSGFNRLLGQFENYEPPLETPDSKESKLGPLTLPPLPENGSDDTEDIVFEMLRRRQR